MLHLVTGGSGSGKSAFAEEAAVRYHAMAPGHLIYIAAMLPYGEETKRKINRHRKLRENKGFQTIERYTGLDKMKLHGQGACVLLECISNLAANEMYQPKGAGKDTVEAIIRGICALKAKCRNLVIVTNEVCLEGTKASEEMIRYKRNMGAINCALAEMADIVTEVVYGIPLTIKGGPKKQKKKVLSNMRMIIGGAYQGKLAYAKNEYKDKEWLDGEACGFEEIYTCGGIFHFEKYLRRMMEAGRDTSGLASDIAANNPDIIIVCAEIGYGLVPIEAFEREYREQTGRICTELAAYASRVDRVICGIGTVLKRSAGDMRQTGEGQLKKGQAGEGQLRRNQMGQEHIEQEHIEQEHIEQEHIELEQVLPADIEAKSFEIITRELGNVPLISGTEPIVKRCIHTSADFDYAKNLVFTEGAVEIALAALKNGASIVTDTQMGKSGINKKKLAEYGGEVFCFMSDEDVAQTAKKQGSTRATASMDKAAALDKKLIFAIGNAPTALVRLYELIQKKSLKPELIIGVPVGFVNVVQSKELILKLKDTPSIVAKGRKGGSNIAACICNALLYMLD